MSDLVPDILQPLSTDRAHDDSVVLDVDHLTVRFPSEDGIVHAVEDVSFQLRANETLGIVGESGSGKSVTSMAILGLLPRYAEITGSVRFRGQEILGMPDKKMRELRGNRISMIFQDALTSLNPVFRVGHQLTEAVAVHHRDMNRSALRTKAIELLDLVGIPNSSDRFDQYPHEYSGGMRQRAMIAMAIANEPDVLIADEPTTALDVTIQAQVLEVLERIRERTGASIMLITHDLGVVAGVAERVLVMYAGREVELGTVDEVFYNTRHPYTMGLLASLPRLDRRSGSKEQLVRIKGQPPSLVFLPPGCAFNPRCPYAKAGLCDREIPKLCEVGRGHWSSCLRADDLVVLGRES